MADEKLHVYGEADIPAKLTEHGLAGWYLEDGWLRRKYTTDGKVSSQVATVAYMVAALLALLSIAGFVHAATTSRFAVVGMPERKRPLHAAA